MDMTLLAPLVVREILATCAGGALFSGACDNLLMGLPIRVRMRFWRRAAHRQIELIVGQPNGLALEYRGWTRRFRRAEHLSP
jgi:hypothetical protein